MKEEANRESAEKKHKFNCQNKLDILRDQKKDLCGAIDQLIQDIEEGKKYIKVYKQMKMYNDEDLNPCALQDQVKTNETPVSLKIFFDGRCCNDDTCSKVLD
tara:strand:- start:203 stop:508 length:306 start_codon:yes stop_codon:yes gene_type:complete